MTPPEQREFVRELGAQIKARRRQLGLTQRQLADRVYSSQAAISRLEMGTQAGVSYVLVVSVLRALNLPDASADQRRSLAIAVPADRPHAPPSGRGSISGAVTR